MDTFISPFNRRVATRYSNVFSIGVAYGDQSFCQSRSLNISQTGLRMVVDQRIGKGRRLHLTLCLDEDNVIEVEGEAVWEECLGSMGTHVVGFEFRHDQVAAQDLIEQWLKERGVAA